MRYVKGLGVGLATAVYVAGGWACLDWLFSDNHNYSDLFFGAATAATLVFLISTDDRVTAQELAENAPPS